jgi:hypothetical protein
MGSGMSRRVMIGRSLSAVAVMSMPPGTCPGRRGNGRGPDQRGFVAPMVEPIAPNLAALRRVSSNAERA